MKTRLTDLVRGPDGEVTTLAALLERGEVTFSMSERFATRNGAIRTAYFADHVSGAGSWEIGKRDYDAGVAHARA